MASADAICASTASGAGTLVYQRCHNEPSCVAARKPSACAALSGSSRTCWPRSVTGVAQAAVALKSGISILQGGHAATAVCHRFADVIESIQPIPEHVPAIALDATIGLAEVEIVDRILGSRSPEKPLDIVAHHVPDRAAKTFALRVIGDGKLVQVRDVASALERLAGQQQRRAVVLRHIDAKGLGCLEVVRLELATERRLDQRPQPLQVQ